MNAVILIGIGQEYLALALNCCLSIKANDKNVKVGLLYRGELSPLHTRFFDALQPLNYETTATDFEIASNAKAVIFNHATGLFPEAEVFIYLDSDVLMLPHRKASDWFEEHKDRGFTAYCNDMYEDGKRSRTDGEFWCDYTKFKKIPQIKSCFIYFTKELIERLAEQEEKDIWAVDYKEQKGAIPADFVFNSMCANYGFYPHQSTYRPICLTKFCFNLNEVYILHNYPAIGLDSSIYWDTRLVSMYNKLVDYYRSWAGIKDSFVYKIKRDKVADKKVYGFWHICMQNHYMEIAAEQLNLMVSSGLYEKADAIYVGCVGGERELEVIKSLFLEYPKFKITTHKTELKEYEFPTLRVLEAKAREINERPFYGFYIHTKGVTYPNPPHRHGGDMFRAYLNYWTITKWKDCLRALEKGKDIAGAGWIGEGEYQRHYRGNFWWADSEYIKTLPEISTLDTTNRYLAEFWIGMGNADQFVICSEVIDYNTAVDVVPRLIKNADKREVEMVRPFGIDKEWHRKQWAEKDITVLIPQRKTKDLIQLCLESLLQFYPDIPVLIVDGDSQDDSTLYCRYKALTIPNVELWERPHLNAGKHTSHGVTLDEALKGHIKTKYVLIMDSDTIVERGGWIEEMLNECKAKKMYAIGTLMLVSRNGEGCKPPENDVDAIRYAHPSCSIIDREMYVSLNVPFGDHGAPLIWNMIAANDKDWAIGYYPVHKYVSHLSGSSWTEPRTIWRDDFGVHTRPFVTFVCDTDMTKHGVELPTENDFDCIYVSQFKEHSVVIHGREPIKIFNAEYQSRFSVHGEYVCEVPSAICLEWCIDKVTDLKLRCIELNAPDEFEVDGIKLVKRQLWQKRECFL